MQPPTDTIAAVSSPPGRSARGLIRISGPNVSAVLEHLLEDAIAEPRKLTPVRLKPPHLPPIPALLLRFTAPASYTGEDLAELQLPGKAALLDRVLHEVLEVGRASRPSPITADGRDGHPTSPNQGAKLARLAEPGEFTFRAYTAGKLDLTRAEGVGATISAVSDSQLAAAGLLRRGELGATAESLVDQIGGLLALVEAGIDFTDQEDVNPIAPDHLDEKLADAEQQLERILSNSRSWGALESLPRVVLVGPPSVGKSTLFNALLGRERAVIDAAPGTTRDVLAEPLQVTDANGRSAEVMLIDLAGLDESLNDRALSPDRDAQKIAHDAIRQADLVVRISDTPDAARPEVGSSAPMINVLSKGDTFPAEPDDAPHAIRISARTGEGLDELRQRIADALADRAVSLQADLLALQPRHEQALRVALGSVRKTRAALAPAVGSPQLPTIELLADTLRGALDALASLGGQLTPDEVIGRVFATFCVGK